MGKSQSSPELNQLLSPQYILHPKLPNTVIHLPTHQLYTLKIIPTHSSAQQTLYKNVIKQYHDNKCESIPRLIKWHKYKKDNRYNDYCAEEFVFYFIFGGLWMEREGDQYEKGDGRVLVEEYENRKKWGMGFWIEEVYAIICCMLCATREYYTYFNRRQWQIELNMIIINQYNDNSLTLIDPLFFQQHPQQLPKPTSRKPCQYFPPQVAMSLKRSTTFLLNQQQPSEYLAQLYRIGAFGVQFLTMDCKQDISYDRSMISRYLEDRGYWSKEANQINFNRQNQQLRRRVVKGISLLLSADAEERVLSFEIMNAQCDRKYCLKSGGKLVRRTVGETLGKKTFTNKASTITKHTRNTSSNQQIPSSLDRLKHSIMQQDKKIRNTPSHRQFRYPVSGHIIKNGPIIAGDSYRKQQINKRQDLKQRGNYRLNNEQNIKNLPVTVIQKNISKTIFLNSSTNKPLISWNHPLSLQTLHQNHNSTRINPIPKYNIKFNYLPQYLPKTNTIHQQQAIHPLFDSTHPHYYSFTSNQHSLPTINHQNNQQSVYTTPYFNSIKFGSNERKQGIFQDNRVYYGNNLENNQEESVFKRIRISETVSLSKKAQKQQNHQKQKEILPNNFYRQQFRQQYQSSPPKTAYSILKQISPQKSQISSTMKQKYSLKSSQNVLVEPVPITYSSSSDEQVEELNTAAYSLKQVNDREEEQKQEISQVKPKEYEGQINIDKDLQRENKISSNSLEQQRNSISQFPNNMKQSIQYYQYPKFIQQKPLVQSVQYASPQNQHFCPQIQSQSLEKSQEINPKKLLKKKSSLINQLLDEDSSLRSPADNYFDNIGYFGVNAEINEKFIKEGYSEGVISSNKDTILGLPSMLTDGLQSYQNIETDPNFLTFSDSNKEISSMKQNKQELKIPIIDNAESVISIQISDSPGKQKKQQVPDQNSPQKDQEKINNEALSKQKSQQFSSLYQKTLRLTPPHYTSTIVEEEVQEDEENNNSPRQRSAHSEASDNQNQVEYVVEEYETGSRYEGFKVNNIRSGMGKFYYQDGGYYDGEWKDNQMHGWGKLYYESGQLAYEGYWMNDEFHGYGKVYNDDPRLLQNSFDYTNFDLLGDAWYYYEGTLMKDTKEGRGRILLTNNQIFEGDFYKDRIQGFGKFLRIDGLLIQGIWRDSRLVKVIRTQDLSLVNNHAEKQKEK